MPVLKKLSGNGHGRGQGTLTSVAWVYFALAAVSVIDGGVEEDSSNETPSVSQRGFEIGIESVNANGRMPGKATLWETVDAYHPGALLGHDEWESSLVGHRCL